MKHFAPSFVFIHEGNEQSHAADRIQNDERKQTTAYFGRSQKPYT